MICVSNDKQQSWLVHRFGSVMDTNLIVPLSVDKTLVHFDFYYDPTRPDDTDDGNSTHATGQQHQALPKWVRDSIKVSDQIQDEDAYVSESVQKGLSSSSYVTGRWVVCKSALWICHSHTNVNIRVLFISNTIPILKRYAPKVEMAAFHFHQQLFMDYTRQLH